MYYRSRKRKKTVQQSTMSGEERAELAENTSEVANLDSKSDQPQSEI